MNDDFANALPVFLLGLLCLLVLFFRKKVDKLRDRRVWGPRNEHMVCPHCHTKGKVRTKKVERKRGVSPGKVVGQTAAFIATGGLSVLFGGLHAGLSRWEKVTQAHCDKCKCTWDF